MEAGQFQARIRPLAVEDLEQIARYLDAHSPTAADRFLQVFFEAVTFLSQMPRAGRMRRGAGRLKGLRSWPLNHFGPYLLFYLPSSDGIEVVRVLHGARHVERELRK